MIFFNFMVNYPFNGVCSVCNSYAKLFGYLLHLITYGPVYRCTVVNIMNEVCVLIIQFIGVQ